MPKDYRIAMNEPSIAPPARAIAEIAAKFPHYSPAQVRWLAAWCTRPDMDTTGKLVGRVICDEAGPDLGPVELSNKQIRKRVNRIIRNAKLYGIDPASPEQPGRPSGQRWGRA